jgi:hypothetical protein
MPHETSRSDPGIEARGIRGLTEIDLRAAF